ncbi:23S rRNA (guanosine(2251)-2'-O)-methyltransferase RlmB [bacterium]|nr:23S rRNA (guanosine(2251)-2'-O)-methyltransferase RlmB [bacterium]
MPKQNRNNCSSSDIVFGKHGVVYALENEVEQIEKIWVQLSLRFSGKIGDLIERAKKHGAVIQYVDKRSLDRISNGAPHQGICLRSSAVNILRLDQWLKQIKNDTSVIVVVLDCVQDPGNIGAIFRSAAASGVQGIIFPKRGSAPLGATAMKTSAGTIKTIPAIRVTNLRSSLQKLQDKGFFVIGLSEKSEKTIVNMVPTRKVALVFGSEDKGIRPINASQCDELRAIPMRGPAGSLNVSAAVSITLYELIRSKSQSVDKN